ncbi:unnamed protein product [Pleuronectes platessa]|uniref:Uncharacterized protein n=1 Tax=Pleuronectes platessa TaxID=8262 RepID=A0A9N7VR96_PLEPL|nr:unnamed protein product [Pleuronectes platessa]
MLVRPKPAPPTPRSPPPLQVFASPLPPAKRLCNYIYPSSPSPGLCAIRFLSFAHRVLVPVARSLISLSVFKLGHRFCTLPHHSANPRPLPTLPLHAHPIPHTLPPATLPTATIPPCASPLVISLMINTHTALSGLHVPDTVTLPQRLHLAFLH